MLFAATYQSVDVLNSLLNDCTICFENEIGAEIAAERAPAPPANSSPCVLHPKK